MTASLSAPTSPLKSHPCFGAAVVWLTFELQQIEHKAAFKHIYQGVLKDKKLRDDDVQAFIREHREELTELVRKHALKSAP